MIKLEPTRERCEAGYHQQHGRFGMYVVTSQSMTDYSGHEFLCHTCHFCGERWYTLINGVETEVLDG